MGSMGALARSQRVSIPGVKATTHKTEMAMGAARGTVVIPAHNAARTLGVCLDALRAQGVPSSDFSLIVVDDASSDGTAAVASRSDVVVLAGPGTGPAAARNVGARAATGEVLVFLDADTVPEQGWLRELVAPLAEPEVVAVKGRYRSAQRSVLARFAQLEFEWKYARLERAERVDFVDTGTAAYRRNAFLGAGGFDEGFRASEDVDLAFRLAAAGAKIVFNPRAVVLHRHTEDLPGYFGKKVRAAYTRTLVYRRYPRKALGDSYTPPLMGLQIALTGATTVALPLALARFPLARTALCTALTGFVLSVLPMVRRSITSDPTLAPLVPALAFLRAFAQGIGAAGAFAQGMLQRRGDAA